MDYRVKLKDENELMKERFDLAAERISQIPSENTVKAPYLDYFHKVAMYIMKMKDTLLSIEDGS